VSIIAAGVTLDYSQAVMLPKEKGDAANLFFVSCLSTLLMSFILLTICLIIPTYLNSLMKTAGIWALILLVVAAMASGLNSSCSAWCVRVKAFKQTSLSQIIRSLSNSGAQIGFGIFQGGAVGLIISNVLASILASINLARVLLSDMAAIRRNISWVRMKQMAKNTVTSLCILLTECNQCTVVRLTRTTVDTISWNCRGRGIHVQHANPGGADGLNFKPASTGPVSESC
jgi:O-antigen/teichoic acid export membrane protein